VTEITLILVLRSRVTRIRLGTEKGNALPFLAILLAQTRAPRGQARQWMAFWQYWPTRLSVAFH